MGENCFEALFHLFKWDTAVILIVDKKKNNNYSRFLRWSFALYRTMYI